MNERQIFVTKHDLQRLQTLIDTVSAQPAEVKDCVRALWNELNRATVIAPADIPADVVTMHSKVVLKDLSTGEQITCTLGGNVPILHQQGAGIQYCDRCSDNLPVRSRVGLDVITTRASRTCHARCPGVGLLKQRVGTTPVDHPSSVSLNSTSWGARRATWVPRFDIAHFRPYLVCDAQMVIPAPDEA